MTILLAGCALAGFDLAGCWLFPRLDEWLGRQAWQHELRRHGLL